VHPSEAGFTRCVFVLCGENLPRVIDVSWEGVDDEAEAGRGCGLRVDALMELRSSPVAPLLTSLSAPS
jgi:hypothetical protein